jgi:hypothetical protein
MENKLRKEVLGEFGKPVNSPKDCELLATAIAEKTKRSISSTTLRRFFGLLRGRSGQSRFNLDTLAIYCNYTDYAEFLSGTGDEHGLKGFVSEELLAEMKRITQHTLGSIERKSMVSFNLTVPRISVYRILNSFIESDNIFLPIIAPGGYGKSIALAQWVKSLDDCQCDVYFFQASVLHHLLRQKKLLPTAYPDNTDSRIAGLLAERHNASRNRQVFIVDAFDETGTNPAKIRELADFIRNLIQSCAVENFLSVIISAREEIWSSTLSHELAAEGIAGLEPQQSRLETGTSNFPPLTNQEIRDFLAKIRPVFRHPLFLETISHEVREMIKIPINLFFFVELFRKSPDDSVVLRHHLLKEYLDMTIFRSRYAEQKEDLIWKILELQSLGEERQSVLKNDLKNWFPIHLKRETEYYHAYADLLSSGILIEERVSNKFGVFTTIVLFRHQDIWFYLSALNFLKNFEGNPANILEEAASSCSSPDRASQIIACLYEIAYDAGDYEMLQNLCMLPDHILSSLPLRLAVGNSFRRPVESREQLISRFASSPKGQIHFFEQYVDTNYFYNNYGFRIREYMKHKKTEEAKLFGNCILYLEAFLKLDAEACRRQISLIERPGSGNPIHPIPLGRKVAYLLLHSHFIDKNDGLDIPSLIDTYRQRVYQYPAALRNGVIEFESPIMIALTLTGQFEVLIDMIGMAMKSYHVQEPRDEFFSIFSGNPNILPQLFLEYARFKTGQAYSKDFETQLMAALDGFKSFFDDFQYLILLHWILCDYLLTRGEKGEALKSHDAALEISRFAEYDFYTVFLLKNDPLNRPESIVEAKEIEGKASPGGKKFSVHAGPYSG